jgi:hypothetical protein
MRVDQFWDIDQVHSRNFNLASIHSPSRFLQSFGQSQCSREKGILDYIPSTSTDRSTVPHPVSPPPLTTIEAVEKVTQMSTTKSLGLLGPYNNMRLVRSILARGGQPIDP